VRPSGLPTKIEPSARTRRRPGMNKQRRSARSYRLGRSSAAKPFGRLTPYIDAGHGNVATT
jgi:hypothetical protein